jgi:hypothetical protein
MLPMSWAGLAPERVAEVDALAQRIAEAVAVRRIGTPFDEQEAASDLKAYGEGSVSCGTRSTTGSISWWWCVYSTSARPSTRQPETGSILVPGPLPALPEGPCRRIIQSCVSSARVGRMST